MSLPHPDFSEQQLRTEIVGLILETHAREVRLLQQIGSRTLIDHTVPQIGDTVLSLGRLSQAEMEVMDINYRRDLINTTLHSIGGLPCAYTNTETGQAIRSSFIAWHGFVRGRHDQHLWTPLHTPGKPITVSVAYMDTLKEKYFDPKPPSPQDNRRAGYL